MAHKHKEVGVRGPFCRDGDGDVVFYITTCKCGAEKKVWGPGRRPVKKGDLVPERKYCACKGTYHENDCPVLRRGVQIHGRIEGDAEYKRRYWEAFTAESKTFCDPPSPPKKAANPQVVEEISADIPLSATQWAALSDAWFDAYERGYAEAEEMWGVEVSYEAECDCSECRAAFWRCRAEFFARR